MRCRANGWPDSPHPFAEAGRAAAAATTCRSCRPSSPWTQMLETPISGRIFLEQVIRDNLDIGRPDQVGLVFAPPSDPPLPSRDTGTVPGPG